MDHALNRCDVLFAAISLDTAPPFGPHGPALLLQSSVFNVSGRPPVSVPVGLGRDNLPLAVQVASRAFDEATILWVGRALERLMGWKDVRLPCLQQALGALRTVRVEVR